MPEPEALARIDIDRQLEAAGWVVQDCDKANLGIFWIRDESLEDAASLDDPDVIVAAINEDLQIATDEVSLVFTDLTSVESIRNTSMSV